MIWGLFQPGFVIYDPPALLHMTTLTIVKQCMKPFLAGCNIYPYGAWLRSRDGSFKFRNCGIHRWHAPTANPM